jgi:multiple sugar transport system permease protein
MEGVGRMISKRREHVWLLLPAVATLLCITIFPLIFSVNVSLRHYSTVGKPVHYFNNFGNYAFILTDPYFYNSLWVTIKFSLLCLLFELPIGFGIALLFSDKKYKLSPLSIFIFLPMAIAPAVVGLVFRWFYSAEVGIVGYMLSLVGIQAPSWTSSSAASMFSVVLADAWEWTPFVFLICLAGLQSIDEEVYEAAQIDGASAWKRLQHITLPLMKPTVVIVVLLRAIPALKEFDKFFVVTAGGPGIATESTSLYVYKQFIWYNNLGTATAAAFILLIVIIVFCQLLFAYLRRQEKW